MPGFESMDRYQPSVLLSKTGVDRHNEPKFAAPVEILVKWNDNDTQATDSQGDKITLNATVVIDPLQVVPIGSLMWLGSLDDWYVSGSGVDTSNLMEVKTAGEGLDLKGRFNRKTVGLAKYRNDSGA